MKAKIDILCYHVKTQSRDVVWSCKFSWLFLFFIFQMYDMQYTLLQCQFQQGWVTLVCSWSPEAVQQCRCRVSKGEVSLFCSLFVALLLGWVLVHWKQP